jgi:hypothetical protein
LLGDVDASSESDDVTPYPGEYALALIGGGTFPRVGIGIGGVLGTGAVENGIVASEGEVRVATGGGCCACCCCAGAPTMDAREDVDLFFSHCSLIAVTHACASCLSCAWR